MRIEVKCECDETGFTAIVVEHLGRITGYATSIRRVYAARFQQRSATG
jgi:hypothetical protein